MRVAFACGEQRVELEVPDGSLVYASRYPAPAAPADRLVEAALAAPIASPSLGEALAKRRPGRVVIVISDITRPIPYADFLPGLVAEIERHGVRREELLLLVATGNHRPSTPAERQQMVGPELAAACVLEDHCSEASDLVPCPAPSRSGRTIRLNRSYMEAGFRLITGLVEPHFMAGFSGGRKAVCPGLASLDSIRSFHGAEFLSDPRAVSGVLEGNPLHEEAVSIARQVPPDFSLQVVLDRNRRVVRAHAGHWDASHRAACDLVRQAACPTVKQPADMAITSSGGYPLDATFYQCVKGFTSCLPALKPRGTLLAFGGCREGVGGPEYTETMQRYTGRWEDFLRDIREPDIFTKDQWQFQLHCRALRKIGEENLHFLSPDLPSGLLDRLSVRGRGSSTEKLQAAVQGTLNDLLRPGMTCAVFPEGPYCAPVEP